MREDPTALPNWSSAAETSPVSLWLYLTSNACLFYSPLPLTQPNPPSPTPLSPL